MRYFIRLKHKILFRHSWRLQFSPWKRRHLAGKVGGEQQLAGRMQALPGASRQPIALWPRKKRIHS